MKKIINVMIGLFIIMLILAGFGVVLQITKSDPASFGMLALKIGSGLAAIISIRYIWRYFISNN